MLLIKEFEFNESYLVDTWWDLMTQHISIPSYSFKKVFSKDVLLHCANVPSKPLSIHNKMVVNFLIWVTFGLYIIWICIKEERWRHFLKFYREMTSGVKVKVKKVKKILSLKSTRNCPICIENWKKKILKIFSYQDEKT